MSKETPKLIHHALNTTSKLIDSDTSISTIDLNLLENLNTNQSLNYLKLEKNLDEIESNVKLLQSLESEFLGYSQELLQIENKVAMLENLINELNSWSQELEALRKPNV
ncbi:hypothetical protein Cantr_03683 [Candida viswanathii]|uniref:Uncharacterized protein n=1 Tax=Candida viswanathii TaxID=5486 RepID=A0A367XMF5_9ASCO|nr:hypothetical protein Cantr_03683 [Candida viswanathii]